MSRERMYAVAVRKDLAKHLPRRVSHRKGLAQNALDAVGYKGIGGYLSAPSVAKPSWLNDFIDRDFDPALLMTATQRAECLKKLDSGDQVIPERWMFFPNDNHGAVADTPEVFIASGVTNTLPVNGRSFGQGGGGVGVLHLLQKPDIGDDLACIVLGKLPVARQLGEQGDVADDVALGVVAELLLLQVMGVQVCRDRLGVDVTVGDAKVGEHGSQRSHLNAQLPLLFLDDGVFRGDGIFGLLKLGGETLQLETQFHGLAATARVVVLAAKRRKAFPEGGE